MTIRILYVGKEKKGPTVDAMNEFLKRLKKFCSVELVEIQDEKVSKDTKRVLEKEGERILKKLDDGPVFVLDEKGKQYSSPQFATLLKKHEMEKVTFVIGSAHGLSEAVKKRADQLISLSSMTWTHQMAKLLLVEQIYRGVCINRNIPYHKE